MSKDKSILSVILNEHVACSVNWLLPHPMETV